LCTLAYAGRETDFLGYGMLRLIGSISLALAIAGCGGGSLDFSANSPAGLPENVDVVSVTPDNVGDYVARAALPARTTLPGSGGAWSYGVGSGDRLVVTVFGHPELNGSAAGAGAEFLVSASGEIFYPYIGAVAVSGKSLGEIRSEISERLAVYIPEPQVDVQVAQFASQSVVVSGAVAQPQPLAITTSELRVSDALARVGGATEAADLSELRVTRAGKTYDVAYGAFLDGGTAQDNPRLVAGDVLNIPTRAVREAYVLGEVGQQSAVDLSLGPITLTQALSRNGGIDKLRGDTRGVFVFRGAGSRVTVFQFDTSTPIGLSLGTKFTLAPSDVVYVVRSPLQRWNDTISKVLPSLSLSRGL